MEIQPGIAHSLSRAEGGFIIEATRPITAATVLLATGVLDRKPLIPDRREATLAGVVRWCPICDGYDVQGQRVALVSPPDEGYKHALFLRTYTDKLSWFVHGATRRSMKRS